MEKVIDIYSKGEYPANVLSNFYPNEFEIDGIKCAGAGGDAAGGAKVKF